MNRAYGGRTFPLDVGASLWPFPGLDCIASCIADTRQSSLLLWEITDQIATSIRGVKLGVSSGFSEHCCRVGEEDVCTSCTFTPQCGKTEHNLCHRALAFCWELGIL